MDGKTTHPNCRAAPTASRWTTNGRDVPPSWLSRLRRKKNTLALFNSPARRRFPHLRFFFSGDDDVAFSTVCTHKLRPFIPPSLALLTRNICKNIFIIYKTLSITLFFFLSTYALCWLRACRHRIPYLHDRKLTHFDEI